MEHLSSGCPWTLGADPCANMRSMGEAGSPYPRFKRALKTGNLHLIRTAAAELDGPLQLDDALAVLAVMHKANPDRYKRAAARWAARATLEHEDVELAELSLLLLALHAPDDDLVERVRRML